MFFTAKPGNDKFGSVCFCSYDLNNVDRIQIKLKTLDTDLGATGPFGLIKELISQNVTEITRRAGFHVGKKV